MAWEALQFFSTRLLLSVWGYDFHAIFGNVLIHIVDCLLIFDRHINTIVYLSPVV